MKLFFAGFGFFANLIFCHAQGEMVRIHHIRIQPFQLFVRELSVEYEMPVLKNLSLGIGGAFRVSQSGKGLEFFENIYSELVDYQNLSAVNPTYSGYKLALTPRWYLDEEHAWYLGTELFYRNWSKEKSYMDFAGQEAVDGYSFSGERKENVNVLGFKLLFGTSQYLIGLGNRSEMNVSIFTGIGFRSKSFTYETWDGTVNGKDIDYLKETGKRNVLSLHLGVLVGVGFSSNPPAD